MGDFPLLIIQELLQTKSSAKESWKSFARKARKDILKTFI